MSLRSKGTVRPTPRVGEASQRSLGAVLAVGIRKDRAELDAWNDTQDTDVFWAALSGRGPSNGGNRGDGLSTVKMDNPSFVPSANLPHSTPRSSVLTLDEARRQWMSEEWQAVHEHQLEQPPFSHATSEIQEIVNEYKLTEKRGATVLDPEGFERNILSYEPVDWKFLKGIGDGTMLVSLVVPQSLATAVTGVPINVGPRVGHIALCIVTPTGQCRSIGKFPPRPGMKGSRYSTPDILVSRAIENKDVITIREATILTAAGARELRSDLSGGTGTFKGNTWIFSEDPYNLLGENCNAFAQKYGLNVGYSTPLGPDLFNRNMSDYGNIATTVGGIALVAYLLYLANKKQLTKKEMEVREDIIKYATLPSAKKERRKSYFGFTEKEMQEQLRSAQLPTLRSGRDWRPGP